MFTTTDVCNGVILMLQFLEVVRQHVLGVVGNIIIVLLQI